MGMGPTYQEQQRSRVQCPEFGVDVVAGLLLLHLKSQHGLGQGDQGGEPPHSPKGGPNLIGLLPKTLVAAPVPGSGVPGWGIESDQTQD